MSSGSRYQEDGGLGGLANKARIGCSLAATRLTKCCSGAVCQQVTDPMSGFLPCGWPRSISAPQAVSGSRSCWRPSSAAISHQAEVGFRFEPRMSGSEQSQFPRGHRALWPPGPAAGRNHPHGSATAGRGIRHRGRQRTGRQHGGLLAVPPLHPRSLLLAAALATQVSTTWNFAGMEIFVFSAASPAGSGSATSSSACSTTRSCSPGLPLLAFLVSVLHCPKTLANVATLLLVFVVRFGVSDRYIYDEEERQNASWWPSRRRWRSRTGCNGRSMLTQGCRSPSGYRGRTAFVLLRHPRHRDHRQRCGPARARLLSSPRA